MQYLTCIIFYYYSELSQIDDDDMEFRIRKVKSRAYTDDIEESSIKDENDTHTFESENSGLRKRHNNNTSTSSTNNNNNNDTNHRNSTGKEVDDPIRMFGILVPNQLRESQHHFTDALRIIVTLAALTKKINSQS